MKSFTPYLWSHAKLAAPTLHPAAPTLHPTAPNTTLKCAVGRVQVTSWLLKLVVHVDMNTKITVAVNSLK